MQLDDVPMPAAVAALPRDVRGYPVLAITPWADGVPRFGLTSTERTLVCAVERRCAICGTRLVPGEAWRVVSAAEAIAMRDAAERGIPYANAAPTVEPPGHRACMTYSAMVCPYLARPNARRGQDVTIEGFTAGRGDRRGDIDGIGGAVAGFRTYEFDVTRTVNFRFSGLISFAAHRLGDDQFDALTALLEAPATAETCPPYLLDDEDLAVERARRYL
jgi:hypothetical protein